FRAVLGEGNRVHLTWSTESEIQNDYFTLMHSVDGYDFEPVVIIDGAGTINEPRDYFFWDAVGSGVHYYALWQTDLNGHTEQVGDIVSVSIKPDVLTKVYRSGDSLVVEHSSFEVLDCKIISLGGQILYTYKVAGPETRIPLPVQVDGIYLVQIGNTPVKKISLFQK
ncbi:MAG: hypothetical protein ACI83D_000091, partial [Planctomycetota bacterium]